MMAVFTVLPMGWSHALNFCEEVHTNALLEEEALTQDTTLRDSRPHCPLAAGIHTEYVGKYVFSFDQPGGVRRSHPPSGSGTDAPRPSLA